MATTVVCMAPTRHQQASESLWCHLALDAPIHNVPKFVNWNQVWGTWLKLPTNSSHMRPGIVMHQEEPAYCTSVKSVIGSQDLFLAPNSSKVLLASTWRSVWPSKYIPLQITTDPLPNWLYRMIAGCIMLLIASPDSFTSIRCSVWTYTEHLNRGQWWTCQY